MSNGAGTCPHTEKIARIEKDMYFGNGKPGLTTRMETVEKTSERIADSLKWIVRLLVATLLTGLSGVIVALVVGRH